MSFIGGLGGMWRLLRQSTSQTPLQSGSFASAAHFCVAASEGAAPDAVSVGCFVGAQPAAIETATAAARTVFLIRARSVSVRPATVQKIGARRTVRNNCLQTLGRVLLRLRRGRRRRVEPARAERMHAYRPASGNRSTRRRARRACGGAPRSQSKSAGGTLAYSDAADRYADRRRRLDSLRRRSSRLAR